MSRALTRRRHGKHRSFDRLRQPASDSLAFAAEQAARLGASEGDEGVHDTMHLEQGEAESFTFEQVQAATDPTDIGLTPSAPPFQQVSLDLNGIDEQLRNTAGIKLGAGADVTWAGWMKRPSFDQDRRPFEITDGIGNNNRFACEVESGGIDLQAFVFSAGGTFLKLYRYTNPWPLNVFTLLAFTWSNTAPEERLKFYVDGVLQIPNTKVIDVSGNGRDDTSFMVYEEPGIAQGVFQAGQKFWSAFWNTDLSPASILEIFNGKAPFDLLTNAGSYTEAANLAHWWQWGFDPTDIGKDTGLAASLIDMNANGQNMSAADIVPDFPT